MKAPFVCCIAAVFCCSCTGLDTGNAQTGTVTFGLSLATHEAPDQAGTVFTLTDVSASVGRIDLYDLDGDHRRVAGPWAVDLLSGAGIDDAQVAVGTYRRVDIRFEPVGGDFTLSARGTVTLDGAETPFVMLLDFSEEARFEGASGITVSEGGTSALLLSLDAASWFEDLPLAQCARDGDLPKENGTLVLTDGRGGCSAIEGAIKDAIKASGSIED